jgi:exodeoxyribonuclease V beta subunit
MKEFDILRIPLEGTRLVEANAGTGKTYALSVLFLRLILEHNLSPGEILVVTYTRAATQELRDRIRRMIRQAIDFFSSGTATEPFVERLAVGHPDRSRSADALTRALRGLDEAAIFTIHGFCQRLLLENAFETGSLFDVELVTQEQALDQEIVEDFWRSHICTAEPELVHYLFHKKWSTDNLLRILGPGLKHPYIRIVPQITVSALHALGEYRKALDALRKSWPGTRDEVRTLLMDPGIKGNAYGVTTTARGPSSPRELKVGSMMAAMDQFLAARRPLFPPFADMEKFSAGRLAASMKKGCPPPRHEYFDLCDRLWDQKSVLAEEMDRKLIFLKGRLFEFVRKERLKRKTLRNIRTYQDLLTDALAALEHRGKESFVRAARAKYQAALIDEFQDTDPVQYRIFKHLFEHEKTPLFYIGDPKQAIYGFRGADVITYLQAAAAVPDTSTLRTNWRSGPDLVQAVNALFRGIERPFVYPEIAYVPSKSAEDGCRDSLHVEGDDAAPLRICVLRPPEGEDRSSLVPKKRAWPAILEFVVSEIARLVKLGRTGKAFIGEEPLSEKHIAVLVRKNREARLVQDALRRVNIPSILYNAGDIFETREAFEVGLVLQAVAEPGSEGHIKAALATDMMGLRGEDIQTLSHREGVWEQRVFDFREYRQIWEEQGFMRMFRGLLTREAVRVRLLAFPDGERRLTNLLHLGEVLHRAALEERLSPDALTTWLFRKMEDPSQESEEHLLRLETDEKAAKIVTVHKSKGLEYPVVFCPSLWDGGSIPGNDVICHDPQNNRQLTMDLGSEKRESRQTAAREELLAENLRILYVAVTRARHRCYVVWGPIRDAESSALAYVLHARHAGDDNGAVQRAQEALRSRSWESLAGDLSRLEQNSAGTIAVKSLAVGKWSGPTGQTGVDIRLEGRSFSAEIPKDWKISSFSSLSSEYRLDADTPDYDVTFSPQPSPEEAAEESRVHPASGIFAFPKGARAGTCLHDILEHLDFAQAGGNGVRSLIANKLSGYGFEEKWVDAVEEMVEKLVSAPFDPGDPDLTLERITAGDRMNELEFIFPLKKAAPHVLQRLFAAHGGPELDDQVPEDLGRLRFSPVRGFLKGFMDMVFHWNGRYYLVDWKSNFLGNTVEDYGPGGLREAMREGRYTLQYHLYTLALDRYLRARLPQYRYENVFGGAFYVFLRGVDPARGPDFGIFRDLPSPDLIHAMRETLIP